MKTNHDGQEVKYPRWGVSFSHIAKPGDDPKSKSWGAWWTAQAQMRQMEPVLQKDLEQHYQGKTLLDEAVIDQTLDAYIQISGSPPTVDLLKAVFSRRPSSR